MNFVDSFAKRQQVLCGIFAFNSQESLGKRLSLQGLGSKMICPFSSLPC